MIGSKYTLFLLYIQFRKTIFAANRTIQNKEQQCKDTIFQLSQYAPGEN